MSKTVLFVVYAFPPTGGSGVQRPTKFVRYLTDYGWKPVVLTVENPAYDVFDESLLADLPPDLPVYHTNAFQPTSLYRKFIRRHMSGFVSAEQESVSSTPLSKRFARAIRMSGRKVIAWVMIPDNKVGWTPYAVREGREIIHKHTVDLIFSTVPPFSSHIVGARLARQTGVPWIADFRDPFVRSDFLFRPTRLHTWLHKDMEKKWIALAHRVVTTAEPTSRDFATRYPDQPPEKWVTITNGYDEDDFVSQEQIAAPPKFELCHVGMLHWVNSLDPDILLRAIRRLIDHDPQAAEDFRLRLIGDIDITYRKPLVDSIQRWQLSDVVQTQPAIPHREAVWLMQSASALLIIFKDASGLDLVIRGKTFEYLRARRPILILSPPGALSELLQGMDSAYFVRPEDDEGITRQIQIWLAQWRAGNLPTPANPGHEQYERRALTQRLAQTFDEVLGGKFS